MLSLALLCAMIPFCALAQNTRQFTMEPMTDNSFSLLKEYFEYDNTLPLDARIVHREERDGYVREKVVFNSILNDRVPGYLALPEGEGKSYPCILALHGLSVSKETWWAQDNDHSGLLLTEGLLSLGYAVMTIDAR